MVLKNISSAAATFVTNNNQAEMTVCYMLRTSHKSSPVAESASNKTRCESQNN